MTEKQTCPVCGDLFWNRGAHAEACTGPRQSLTFEQLKSLHRQLCPCAKVSCTEKRREVTALIRQEQT